MAGMMSNSRCIGYALCTCMHCKPRGAGKNKAHKKAWKATIKRKEEKTWRNEWLQAKN
jgi:hypothetical protein